MTAPATTTPWQIDASHTEVEFSVRHLMISNVKGRFSSPTGSVDYDPAHPTAIALTVEIPVATVDTRNEQRDAHLRNNDFFDAPNFPTMTFKAHSVAGNVEEEFDLIGELTLRGVTKPLTLHVTSEGRGGDPWGNERLGFSATGEVNRIDFGVKYNAALETGGVVIGDTVKIIINTELMRPKS
jgi:polyisoprenoid-binding protein YceI